MCKRYAPDVYEHSYCYSFADWMDCAFQPGLCSTKHWIWKKVFLVCFIEGYGLSVDTYDGFGDRHEIFFENFGWATACYMTAYMS